MDPFEVTPGRIVSYYNVRYWNTKGLARVTRWKMTAEDAAAHFAGQKYELVEHSREDRRTGDDPMVNSMARFYNHGPNG